MSEISDAVSVSGDNGEHAGEGIHGVGGSAVREEEDGSMKRGEVARLGFRGRGVGVLVSRGVRWMVATAMAEAVVAAMVATTSLVNRERGRRRGGLCCTVVSRPKCTAS